ncbi:MAG: HD domain-containing protein [Desulfobacteraceae bacterium]|nr:HD domain-containing protein [Desulfobacteraceae bacterium]
MKIPTKDQCYRMLSEMKMMDHIVVHSLQVCRVATFLSEKLNRQQYRLNFDLIQAAALLHDITKTRSFKTREDHALTGGQFLAKLGYPRVGELVRQHVRLDEYPKPVVLGEVQIINYADKRVLHDQVVSLDKRLDYILEKYAKTPEHTERIHWLWGKTREMEVEIFRTLPLSADDLTHLINPDACAADVLEYRQISKSVSSRMNITEREG